MKSSIFWGITSCSPLIFHRLHGVISQKIELSTIFYSHKLLSLVFRKIFPSEPAFCNGYQVCANENVVHAPVFQAVFLPVEEKSEILIGRIDIHHINHFKLDSWPQIRNTRCTMEVKMRIYKTIILPVVLYGCETWSLTLREEHRLRVFENRVLRRISGPKRNEVR
jgi:hypothetical protein